MRITRTVEVGVSGPLATYRAWEPTEDPVLYRETARMPDGLYGLVGTHVRGLGSVSVGIRAILETYPEAAGGTRGAGAEIILRGGQA